MKYKVKLDPSKITYDGRGFSIVSHDDKTFKEKLEQLRNEVHRGIDMAAATKRSNKKVKRRVKTIINKQHKKEAIDPRIEEIYEKEITFTCPVRGKVTQKVKVKRYKPLSKQGVKRFVNSKSELSSTLGLTEDELTIHDDGESLGIIDSSEDKE